MDNIFADLLKSAQAQALERKHPLFEWSPCAVVAVYIESNCTACNSSSRVLSGLFHQLKHKRDSTAFRLDPIDYVSKGLPKKTQVFSKRVPGCSRCLTILGFPWDSREIIPLGEAHGIPGRTIDDLPADRGRPIDLAEFRGEE